MTLSAVLAVRDEEEMLEGALRSLRFCDEIVVVVDDRSTDRTEEIARRYADNVLVEPFSDFATDPKRGIARRARRLDPARRRRRAHHAGAGTEIRAALAAGADVLAFRGPTINFFWGRRMEHGGWARMKQRRLVRRDHAEFTRPRARGHRRPA